MHNSAVISAWSIDAFECLIGRLYKKMSHEQISRTEMFISSFVLFDKVYLTEKYINNRTINALNLLSNDAINLVSKNDLIHSIDARDHISFDVDLHMLSFNDLAEENKTWLFQNDPDLWYEYFLTGVKDKKIQDVVDSNFFTQFRLWQWCLANEMSALTNSVTMLPISLNAVSDFAIRKKKLSDIVLKRYCDYAEFHGQKFAKFSEIATIPFVSELKYIPPLFSIFLDRSNANEDAIDVLVKLREDYSEFRGLRHKFTAALSASNTISEQNDIVCEWNASWRLLTAGEFKKPSLLKRKLSSTEISSSVISLETAGIKNLVKHLIDHVQYKRSYNLFRIFGEIDDDIGKMASEKALLHSLFGVEQIVPIIKL